MRPHTEHFYDVLFFDDLIDQPVLDIDAMRVCPGKVAHRFFMLRQPFPVEPYCRNA